MRHLTLNRIFFAYLIYFILVVLDFLPRATVPYATAMLLAWTLLASLEEATLFFLRSIPLLIAIPLTASYDNLNMWRLLALVLIIRLFLQRITWQEIIFQWKSCRRSSVLWLKSHPVFRRLVILLIFAFLSLLAAEYPLTGLKRIIYFGNLSIVPIVLYVLLRRGQLTTDRVIRNLAIPAIIVIIVGFVQLASTYLIDVYQFMRVWGEGIQLRQFGQQWSYIATQVGNTWLAYYGDQLSLRVFSLFPDSHSFPTFVLLGLPALFAIALEPIRRLADSITLKKLARTRASWLIIWVPLALLIVILSGTRGVWAASLGVVALAVILIWFFRHLRTELAKRRVFSYISLYLIAFFMLFAIAWPIFISPQFLLGKGDLNMLGYRIRSVIDFGETSNALRLAIWKSTIVSIANNPLLGVGIGNFPVVLDQDIGLARAGSTAHNLYLHVPAEMGILAGLELIVLLVASWLANIRWFLRASGRPMVYAGALLLFLPWVLAYVLTDPIIFDERVFLIFASTLVLIWANRPELKQLSDRNG